MHIFSYLCIFFLYLTQHPSCNFCSHNKACIEHVDYCKHKIFICSIKMFPSKQHQKSECDDFCETQWYDHSIAVSNEYGKSAQRTPKLLLCLILAKIKFFVIRDNSFLLKYQITALMLETILTKKVFF